MCVHAWAEAEGRCSMSCPITSHLIPSLSLSLELAVFNWGCLAREPLSTQPWYGYSGSELWSSCLCGRDSRPLSQFPIAPYALSAPGVLSLHPGNCRQPAHSAILLVTDLALKHLSFPEEDFSSKLNMATYWVFFLSHYISSPKMNWLPSCQDGLPFHGSQATGQSKMDPEDEMAFTKKHLIEKKMVSRERQARVSVNPVSKWEVNVFKVTISHQVSLRSFIHLLILIQNSSLEAEGGLFFISLDKAVLKRLWVNKQNELRKEVWRQRVSD